MRRLAKPSMTELQTTKSSRRAASSLPLARLFALLCLSLCACALQARPAQDPSSGESAPQDAAHRNAEKAAVRGDKADAQGHTEEAWKDYQEASRYLPNDKVILERTAALRSKLIREHTEPAERLALNNDINKAVFELNKALLIDPGDAIIAERLQEMKAMEDELPPQPKPGAGFPSLKTKPGTRNFNL